jgi:hypothetical protein
MNQTDLSEITRQWGNGKHGVEAGPDGTVNALKFRFKKTSISFMSSEMSSPSFEGIVLDSAPTDDCPVAPINNEPKIGGICLGLSRQDFASAISALKTKPDSFKTISHAKFSVREKLVFERRAKVPPYSIPAGEKRNGYDDYMESHKEIKYFEKMILDITFTRGKISKIWVSDLISD